MDYQNSHLRILLVTLLIPLIGACSILERKNYEANEEEAEIETSRSYMDNELSRMNSKIVALETKLATMESQLAKGANNQYSQPKITVEEQAKKTKNAGMDHSSSPFDDLKPQENLNEIENKFQASMHDFQSAKYQRAATSFATLASTNNSHLLSSHALYWSGESYARMKRWRFAIEQWEQLQNHNPRSVYMPEVLAGLSRAYAEVENKKLSDHYRRTLIDSFPDSPATLNFMARYNNEAEGK